MIISLKSSQYQLQSNCFALVCTCLFATCQTSWQAKLHQWQNSCLPQRTNMLLLLCAWEAHGIDIPVPDPSGCFLSWTSSISGKRRGNWCPLLGYLQSLWHSHTTSLSVKGKDTDLKGWIRKWLGVVGSGQQLCVQLEASHEWYSCSSVCLSMM